MARTSRRMSIIVVCPACRKSFKVSEKFAGQTGPCPNCKKPLRVPTKEEEVKVHAPEEFAGGGKTTSGKLVTKPIARVDTKLRPVAVAEHHTLIGGGEAELRGRPPIGVCYRTGHGLHSAGRMDFRGMTLGRRRQQHVD